MASLTPLSNHDEPDVNRLHFAVARLRCCSQTKQALQFVSLTL